MDIKLYDMNDSSVDESAKQIVRILLSDKAYDVKLFDVSEQTILCERYVIATANSSTHLNSLTDDLYDKMGKCGKAPKNVEGRAGGEWILVDFGEVICHLFIAKSREFYNLERLLRSELDTKVIEEELNKEIENNLRL